MDCRKKGKLRKDGLKRHGKAGDCGEGGADGKSGCHREDRAGGKSGCRREDRAGRKSGCRREDGAGGKSGCRREDGDGGKSGCRREGSAGGKSRCRGQRRRILYIGILTCMVFLHIAAWGSRGFCDWYQEHVFGIWVDTYGRLMGMVPFSVGELLIGFEAGFAAVGAVLGAMWLIGRALEEVLGKEREQRGPLGRVCRAYCRAGLWMLLVAFILMTLNCYILYHGSGFSGTYLIGEDRDYTLEELAALRNFVVEQCNVLCCQIPRKEDGTLSYEGDMLETAKAAMGRLGETYEGLGGFYPTPKPLLSSDFMSQQHIAGCYYPFSMEANYNDVMYVMNLPSTLCHELGHLKGYIREDEANLIGYLACVRSEDIFFQYSGYLSVLYYVEDDFRQAVESSGGSAQMPVPQQDGLSESKMPEQPETWLSEEAWGPPDSLVQAEILPQVHADNIFLTTQERARIEREALLDTETVDVVSDSIADASLKLKGVRDGMISYSKVVELLLRYYDVYGYP